MSSGWEQPPSRPPSSLPFLCLTEVRLFILPQTVAVLGVDVRVPGARGAKGMRARSSARVCPSPRLRACLCGSCAFCFGVFFFPLSRIDLLGRSPEPECAHFRVRRVCHVFYSHFVFLFHLLSCVQLPPFQETIPSHCQSGLAATALSSSAAPDFSLPLSLVPLSPISLTQPPSGVRAQAECEKSWQ